MGTVIDKSGIRLDSAYDGPLDVTLAGHRVWSFTTKRDAVRKGRTLFVAWPEKLAERLEGEAEVAIVPHNGGDPVFRKTIRFGSSRTPLELVDDLGHPLSVDKGGRLQRTFDNFADDSRSELVTAAHRVLVDLVEHCGLDAYLCYGGLLGAAREGRMIGHDSDLDLAWLSGYTHPFDIVRESRAAQRAMTGRGWQVVGLSGANFKIWVPLPSGKRAGVDVFGSFHVGDHFHIMGNLRGRLPREAIVPFGEIDLEGVRFPAPADVSAFLAYTYGPDWRVPNPAFHFDHPQTTIRRMSAWFRGGRTQLPRWQAFYQGPAAGRVPTQPSSFARWAAQRMQVADPVVELGAGTGRDAIWFVQQGYPVLATDFTDPARKVLRERAAAAGVQVPFRIVNLESLRSTLIGATRIAHEDGPPRHVYARGLVDTVRPSARLGLWRFCQVAGRRGGHTFLEFDDRSTGGGGSLGTQVLAEVVRHRGHVVEDTTAGGQSRRLVISWRTP